MVSWGFCMYGVMTALATPFKNGKIDEEAFRAFIEWQIEQGIHGLIPCGTTGESATLSHEEHQNVIKICIDQVKKRVPVIAGAGSNSTKEAISLTEFAKKAGADGALHITPYYNRPTQEGVYLHFKAISEAVDFPLVLYNVPARTGSNVLPETIARIRKDIKQVVAVKESCGNIVQISNVIEQCDDDIAILSGDDFLLLPMLALGAKGIISVTANVAPKAIIEIYDAFKNGDIEKARAAHFKVEPLNRALFIETNPIPTKTALSLMGKMDCELRLPLCNLQADNHEKLVATLKELNLI